MLISLTNELQKFKLRITSKKPKIRIAGNTKILLLMIKNKNNNNSKPTSFSVEKKNVLIYKH